ncbi:hypothetical protein HPP92_009607 [Vanilla planifolia]|uniref:Elongin A binding-protein 1 domain-containing protein n=1 Tax=Vanilla planifolia TaxID=51239 RepID=A0A835RK87_VANPL|nr:hypothetical protein HPP92_009607 [Vanilla planifolia]
MLSENSQLDNNNLDKVNNLREVSRVSLNDDNHLKANKNLITKSTLQVYSSDIVDKKLHAPSFQSAKANQKPNSGGAAAESIQTSGSSYSKVSLTFSKGHALSDARTDKIKWAQEVLSRKISSTNVNTSKGVEHDNNTLLKGKYPLLAQLPLDMRPVPVSARHSKVPVSVRQNQLYRIAEHYLRRTNLQVIRRTAETELAIADAINVEKGIFERSNSKLVYVNLCSLAVSQHTNQSVLADSGFSDCSMINFNVDGVVAEATTSDSETGQRPESAVTTLSNSTVDTSKMSNAIEDDLLTDHKTSEWNSVEEALKMAGLFSETPPNSPYRVCEESNLQEAARGDIKEEEGPATDSVVEAFPSRDSKSESSIQQIPENTAECDCINVVVEPPFSSSNPLEIQKESESEKSLMVVSMDNPAPTTKYEGERNDDPYLEERQVMQGPNKQHLVNQISAKDVNEMQKPLQIREEKYEISAVKESHTVNDQSEPSVHDSSCDISNATLHDETAAVGDTSQSHSMGNVQLNSDNTATEEMKKPTNDKSELTTSISKKVEAYIKEHIRPLCKSGIITVEQYRWAVGKAVDKVMKFHYNAKNANFLIREGEKVKKLAEQYLEAAQRKELR